MLQLALFSSGLFFTRLNLQLVIISSSPTQLCKKSKEKELMFTEMFIEFEGFSGGSDGKESACNAGNPGLISGWGRAPGEGHDNPLQYSCLENPMDKGAWQATAPGVTNSRTPLSD